MRDLGTIAGNLDLDLAVCAAQLVGHEAAKVPDHDAIIDLQAKLEVRCATSRLQYEVPAGVPVRGGKGVAGVEVKNSYRGAGS